MTEILEQQILRVTPSILDRAWPHLLKLLSATPEVWSDYYSIEDIWNRLCYDKMQLWLMNDEKEFQLAMLTEVVAFPQMTVLNVFWLAGHSFRKSLVFADYLEKIAAENGIDRISFQCRRGFVKLLKPYGYREAGVVLTKNIRKSLEN